MSKIPTDPKFTDLSGRTFGRLSVIGYAGKEGRLHYWNCQCECGAQKHVIGGNLRRGLTQSCGCLGAENRRSSATKHGLKEHGDYSVWESMRNRCMNPNNHAYALYGGRGIYVCAEWNDFETFLREMGPRPSKKHSIDRVDNDGPYCKANCRWATAQEQAENRRTSRLIEHNGESLTIAAWEKRLGMSPHTVWKRLKRGWTVVEALTSTRKKAPSTVAD